MALALIIPVDSQLAKQGDRHGVRLVTLLCLGQEASLDLSGAQRNLAGNLSCGGAANNVGT